MHFFFMKWNYSAGCKKIFKIMSTLIYRDASINLLNEGLNQKFTFYCWKTPKKLKHWTENCTNLEYLRRFWTWAGNLPFKNCWKINSTKFWFTSFAIHADAFQPSINHNYNTPLTKNFTVLSTRFNSNKTKVNRFTSFLSNFGQVLTINDRFGDKRFMAAEFGVTRIFLFESFRFLLCIKIWGTF